MAEVKNNILQNAGAKGGAYIVPGDGALDARFVVTTYATLSDENGWQLTLKGETVKTLPYVGLTTYAQDTQKLYVCTKVGTGTNLFNGIEWKEVAPETDVQAELGDGSSEKPHLVWTVDETTNEGKWEAGKIETTSVTKNEVSETNDVENYTIADSDASVNVYSKETVDIMFGWGTIEITENEQQ